MFKGARTTPPNVYQNLRVRAPTTGTLMQRLVKDGGKKILKLSRNTIHIEYTRFIEPMGEIKGLSLDDALLQLQTRPIEKTLKDTIVEMIIELKEKKFDLSKTYIAEAFVKNSSHGLSKLFVKKYLKGRGRYGSTPHPKTALLEFTFQQRKKQFKSKLDDPLGNYFINIRMDQDKVERESQGTYPDSRTALYC